MLPKIYRQRYQDFRQILERLQALISQPEFDCLTLKAEALTVQQFFQDQVRSLDLEALDPTEGQRSHSFHVEINKQLRLLAKVGTGERSGQHINPLLRRIITGMMTFSLSCPNVD